VPPVVDRKGALLVADYGLVKEGKGQSCNMVMGGAVHMAGGGKCLVIILMGLAVCLTGTASVWADGDGRRATPEEQAFYRKIQDLLAAALPVDAPEGWEVSDQSGGEDLEVVGEDARNLPLAVDYYLLWSNVELQQQMEEQTTERFSAIAAESPVSEDQIREYEELAAKIADTAAAGDVETLHALQRQMEQKAETINRALAAVDEKIAEINRAASVPDAQVFIQLFANRFFLELEPGAERTVVAGYPAFRRNGYHEPSGEYHEGVIQVFLGRGWGDAPEGSVLQFTPSEDFSRTSLQTVVVVIEADPGRAVSIVEMIDWPSLQAALEDEAR